MSLHFWVEHDNSGQSPTVLKDLSDGTLVGGGARNFCASGDNSGDLCMFMFHQEAGSSWWLMSGSDKNWSNSALIKLPSADMSWSSASKPFQRPDPVCLSTGCSLLLTEVEDSSRSSSTISCCSKYYLTGQLPQIRSKFWPEPDLAGFPKKGRMPDLPEPEPKSGTSLAKT